MHQRRSESSRCRSAPESISSHSPRAGEEPRFPKFDAEEIPGATGATLVFLLSGASPSRGFRREDVGIVDSGEVSTVASTITTGTSRREARRRGAVRRRAGGGLSFDGRWRSSQEYSVAAQGLLGRFTPGAPQEYSVTSFPALHSQRRGRRTAVYKWWVLHKIFRIQHSEALRVQDRVQATICTIHSIERMLHGLEDCTLKHRSFSGHGPCGVCTGTLTPTPFEFALSLT